MAQADARTQLPGRAHPLYCGQCVVAAQRDRAAPVARRSGMARAVYDLSSGASMDVRAASGAVHQRWGQRLTMGLHQDDRGHFVSADGRVARQFEPAADGQPRTTRLQVADSWL